MGIFNIQVGSDNREMGDGTQPWMVHVMPTRETIVRRKCQKPAAIIRAKGWSPPNSVPSPITNIKEGG